MFVGDELAAILTSIENGTAYNGCGRSEMEIGVHVLPHFPKDTTDRNRPRRFAFTGNKFEFRMLGSSLDFGTQYRAKYDCCRRTPAICRRTGESGRFYERANALVKKDNQGT